MSAYDYNVFRVSEELLPPQIRRPKMLAWLRVILNPLSRLKDLFRRGYLEGSLSEDYDNAATYLKYEQVVLEDFYVYELKVTSSVGVAPTGDTLSETNWRRVLTNHIGADERVWYNNQIIILEYALNKYFRNPSPADQIYLTVHSPWTAGTTAFTVNVPVALHTSLGGSSTARNNRVRAFVDQYNNPAYIYAISTY